MTPLTVSLDEGRRAFVESVDDLLAVVEPLRELDLLGASRCHGWHRLDVLVHVVAGWQEMLGGMVARVSEAATVDAASYWPAFAREYGEEDPVATLMAQRRRGSAYARPAVVLDHLRGVAAAVRRGAEAMPDERVTWQGHVFTAGDFLAVWAVEDAVHRLDLDAGAPPASEGLALGLTRRTVEALAGPVPAPWSDVEVALVGAGREPVPDDAGDLAARLPVI